MKKMFLVAVAAIASTVLFAGAPTKVVTEQYLKENYDCVNNYVVAIWYDMNLTCVNAPYAIWAGTVNGWSNVNDENAIKPDALEGEYEGWFVFEFADESETVQGKPLVLDTEGKGSWDYQSGTPDTWIHKGGKEANIVVGGQNPAESDLTWPEKGAYIYEITGLKNGANPCTVVYQDYTLRFYVPEFCDALSGEGFDYADSVHIDGGFDGWSGGIFMTADVDEDFNEYYYVNLTHIPQGTEFLVRLGTMGYDDKISGDQNQKTGVAKDTTYYFNTKPWTACATAKDYDIYLKAPAMCDPNISPAIVGSGTPGGWDAGTAMEWNVEKGEWYIKLTQAVGEYKFYDLEKGWDNEIQMYNTETGEWGGTPNMQLGDETEVHIDYSDAAMYRWKMCDTPSGVEDIKAALDADGTYIINGQMYIKNNGKLINVLGF